MSLTTNQDEIPAIGCDLTSERECADGSCVLKNKFCVSDEEEVLNQNTILIIVVIGMAVVVFLIILYCFQKKPRNGTNRDSLRVNELGLDDEDNTSLYNPPPTYDEVTSGLYQPTPQSRRAIRISSSEEPITPPPNYQAALTILAQSHESVLVNRDYKWSNVFRRSVSIDSVGRQTRTGTVESTSPTSLRLSSVTQ